MFWNCISLTSLNLYDFGIIKILNAGSLFRECTSLTYLNLSNFDMSQNNDIGSMFKDCTSLISLDLSNMELKINFLQSSIFQNCIKLEYINLEHANFNIGNINLLDNTAKNMVLCIKNNSIAENFKGYRCSVIDCSDNWRLYQKKINLGNDNECIDDCLFTDNNKYNYNSKCYNECPSRTYNNNYICEDCHPDCESCEESSR